MITKMINAISSQIWYIDKSLKNFYFWLGGSSNTDSGKVDGSLETKYKFAEYGTTFTEKWNTNNQHTWRLQDQ